MVRFQFNQFKGTITQALIVIKSIDDFWNLDMLLSTLDNYPDSIWGGDKLLKTSCIKIATDLK